METELFFYNDKHEEYTFLQNGLIMSGHHCLNSIESRYKKNTLSKISEEHIEKKYSNAKINKLTFFLTNDCNLKCSYCYQHHKEKKLLSLETFRNSLNFLVKEFNLSDRLQIIFFGGEPLFSFEQMKIMVDICKNEYSQFFKPTFSITTNGTLLKENLLPFFIENKFYIMVSVDNGKDIHDRHRLFLNGNPSYDIVIKNIKEIAQLYPISIRTTIPAEYRNIREFAEELEKIGIFKLKFLFAQESFSSFEEAKKIIDQTYNDVSQHVIDSIRNKKYFNYEHITDILIKLHFGLNSTKVHPCVAGISELAINTNGDISMCQRFFDFAENTIGNTIYDKNYSDQKRKTMMCNLSLFSRNKNNECLKCWARYLCGGTCYYDSQIEHNNINIQSEFECYRMRKLIEICLIIYSSTVNDEPDFYNNLLYLNKHRLI